jgi:site-specific DNA-methyltransferase (adenine-specific)
MLEALMCGDVMEQLKLIPDNSVDLIVTSPPYNVGIKYDNYDDARTWDNYYCWCGAWLGQLLRVMKPDGRCCINMYLSLGTSKFRTAPLMTINQWAVAQGFKHHSMALWYDVTLTKLTAWGSWLSASAPYVSAPFEGILILYKDQWKKQNKGVSTTTKEEFREFACGVWKFAPNRRSDHPAPFPEKLAARCINGLSYVGDTVLDPFLGTGTTAIAAKKASRGYIGIDISPDYIEKAKVKLAAVVVPPPVPSPKKAPKLAPEAEK